MTPTQPKRCQPARSRRTVSPGLQGKAGSRGRRDGLPLISGGGVGGKAPDPSSTDSERWRLFRFLFGRSKRNIAPGDERSKANDFQPKKQKETRFSHSNIACSAMENRGTAISGPSAAAWGGGWPPKRRLRAPVAIAPAVAGTAPAAQTRDRITRAGKPPAASRFRFFLGSQKNQSFWASRAASMAHSASITRARPSSMETLGTQP